MELARRCSAQGASFCDLYQGREGKKTAHLPQRLHWHVLLWKVSLTTISSITRLRAWPQAIPASSLQILFAVQIPLPAGFAGCVPVYNQQQFLAEVAPGFARGPEGLGSSWVTVVLVNPFLKKDLFLLFSKCLRLLTCSINRLFFFDFFILTTVNQQHRQRFTKQKPARGLGFFYSIPSL